MCVSGEDWQIRVLYEGECPLCSREIRLLERMDRGRGGIDCADISAPDFDAAEYGLDQADLMARIHGVLPDGGIVEDVEVFRRAYQAVGWGWLLAPTRWPLLRGISDAAYRSFARNRLRWTRRGHACGMGACGDENRETLP